MAKVAPTPVVKKDSKKDSKKNTKVGNSKKSAPARSTKITSREVIAGMTSAEIAGSLNKIDFDKVVDYKAAEYQRVKGKHEMTEAFYVVTPDGKEHFVGQTLAVAFADAAEADPLGFMLQLIAYKRGNPYLAK